MKKEIKEKINWPFTDKFINFNWLIFFEKKSCTKEKNTTKQRAELPTKDSINVILQLFIKETNYICVAYKKKIPAFFIAGIFKIKFYLCFLVLNLPPLISFSKKLPTCSPTSVNTTPVAPS